jgi:RimJ/RimL family protein N-acetyltransferase
VYITLQTERLLLRPIDLKDASFIFELLNTEDWLKFIGDRNVLDESDAEEYIQQLQQRLNSYYNVFELKGTKKAIGVITFLHREEEQFPDIGFALLPDFQNKGYTTEAARAYMRKIEKSGKYDNIIALTMPKNERSIRVIEKLGFSHQFDAVKESGMLSYFSQKKITQPWKNDK